MTNTKILFIFPFLLMFACASTAQTAVMSLPTATRAPPLALVPTPQVCHVKTGFEAGTLNLRTCGGTYCSTVIILHEGETLTRTLLHTVDGWIPVRNSGGLHGWVNSKYITCPPYENKMRKK